MKRSLTTAAVALLLAVFGLAALAETSSASGVLPAKGHYKGHDHHGRTITFYYDGQHQMHHFTVSTFNHHGHLVSKTEIGGAHLIAHESRWSRTCHNGKCSNGAWVSDFTVHGSWDLGDANRHVPYHAHWVY